MSDEPLRPQLELASLLLFEPSIYLPLVSSTTKTEWEIMPDKEQHSIDSLWTPQDSSLLQNTWLHTPILCLPPLKDFPSKRNCTSSLISYCKCRLLVGVLSLLILVSLSLHNTRVLFGSLKYICIHERDIWHAHTRPAKFLILFSFSLR